jgi:xanthine dehydrogenase small subunit
MHDAISFLRRGRRINLRPSNPTQTVLDWLRLEEKSKGTKEGCNEGDCGACTVAIGRLKKGKLVYEPANACILFVGHLHGCELVTVDELARDGVLHPVQDAMVNHHASQCGFCTPGFVMSLFTLYHRGRAPTRQEIVDHLAGNLCRCTGYRPIVDAAAASCTGKALDHWASAERETIEALHGLDAQQDVVIKTSNGFLAIPSSAEALAQVAAENPDATIVSGATDVGLWVNKQMRVLPRVIHTFNVESLHRVERDGDALQIGAASTYSEAMSALAAIDEDIGEVLRRLGSKHVRATGTIGGNIANGSPIGDTPPMLIALGATLHLQHGATERSLPLEEFFIAYGKQDRKPGELVWRIDVPVLKTGEHFRAYKISKRFDQDISAVMFALKVSCEGDMIVAARLAMGGMAATPKRAMLTEDALKGLFLSNEESWNRAVDALALDYQPISDMRASATYRLETAQALLHKALLELAQKGDGTRLVGDRTVAA